MSILYGIGDQEILTAESVEECVEQHLDDIYPGEPPKTLMVEEYRQMTISNRVFDIALGNLEELLNEEYGNPEDTTPLLSCLLWESFIEEVKKTYKVWGYEKTGNQKEVVTADYVAEKES